MPLQGSMHIPHSLCPPGSACFTAVGLQPLPVPSSSFEAEDQQLIRRAGHKGRPHTVLQTRGNCVYLLRVSCFLQALTSSRASVLDRSSHFAPGSQGWVSFQGSSSPTREKESADDSVRGGYHQPDACKQPGKRRRRESYEAEP